MEKTNILIKFLTISNFIPKQMNHAIASISEDILVWFISIFFIRIWLKSLDRKFFFLFTKFDLNCNPRGGIGAQDYSHEFHICLGLKVEGWVPHKWFRHLWCVFFFLLTVKKNWWPFQLSIILLGFSSTHYFTFSNR